MIAGRCANTDGSAAITTVGSVSVLAGMVTLLVRLWTGDLPMPATLLLGLTGYGLLTGLVMIASSLYLWLKRASLKRNQ